MPTIQTTVAPAFEPLVLSDVKLYLELDDTRYDALVTSLCKAAREYAEMFTSLNFAPRTVTEFFDCFPLGNTISLSLSPANAVTSVKYIDEQEVLQTWPSSNYHTDLISSVPRVVKVDTASWPDIADLYPNAVQIAYTTGYVVAPETVKQAMKLMIAFWFENREDIQINETNNPRIRSAQSLLNLYKQIQ
jgi:uncharacterized phiE125 gp8 family phage protein